MALENVRQSMDLTGQSMIDGVLVAEFSCRIATNGMAGAISTQIRNQEKYDTSRTQFRKDHSDFTSKVWAAEDQLASAE